MRRTLTEILDILEKTNTRAGTRADTKNYTEETHLVVLRFDLRELLQDLDDSIAAHMPAHRGEGDRHHRS